MGEALLLLGYKVVGARLDLAEPLLRGDIDFVLQEAQQYDAFQDMPWAVIYKELDEAFPNSKFILTQRDEQKWLNSAIKHFGENTTLMREWVYGAGKPVGNEAVYIERYQRHNREVQQYFHDRPDDLLIMSWAEGDGWAELCSFLGVPIPKVKFPHANKGKHSYNLKDKIYTTLRGFIPGPTRRKILDLLGRPDKRDRFNNFGKNTDQSK